MPNKALQRIPKLGAFCTIRLGLFLIAMTLCSGCASAIYKGGRFHDVLQQGISRDEIRRAMGSPLESGEERNFGVSVYDDFVVRGPVCDASRSAGAAMGAGMTLGLSELIAMPQALWWSLTDRGQKRVRVLYSAGGFYQLHFVQGAKRAVSRKNESVRNAEQDRYSEPLKLD